MKNALRNWQTSIFGILALIGAATQIYHNPASATDPTTAGAIAAGIGLIVAKDSNKSGTATGS